MAWEKIAAAVVGFFTAMMPYLEKALLLLAGKKLAALDTANQALKDVKKANEAVAAHSTDTHDERLQRMDAAKRVRD